jgi:serine/threonine protein kinase
MNQFSFSKPKELDDRLKKLDAHHGGEGSVYNDHQHLAIKIFNAKEVNVARKERKVRKLIQQSQMIGYNEAMIPMELVTVNGHFVGYTMKYVKDAVDLDHIAEKTFMGERDLRDSLKLMIKVAQAVEKIHNTGMIIGDFHPGQVLVSNGNIFFVDTDSWGWMGQSQELGPDLKCLPFYVDPKSRDFSSRDVVVKHYSKASDYYSLAVIAFNVLTGEHPFGGVYQIDTKMSKELRARNQLSVLGEHDIKIMKGKTWEAWMTDELKEAFLDIFERGKRYNIEVALSNQLMELQYCKRHKGYYNSSYKNCPVCSSDSAKNALSTTNNFSENLFLSNTDIKKVYDYRTYLNKVGEVVRVNERGEKIRKNVKGFGKIETYFFDDERYRIKIKPLNFFQKIDKSGNVENACYVHLYKEDTEIEKIFVSNKTTVRIYGNCLFYVEDDTHTLKKLTVLNGDVKITDIAKKQTDFEYVATTNSKYAIISKHQNGIEIDIDGNCTVIPGQRPLIMKYDAISNMWIWISKVSNSKYNTIVFRRGKPVIQTTDINYDSMNLQGSVFHRATLCLASDGKMISVMPYVVNMPISKVITESMISVISKDSTLEIKQISENCSELYVLNADRNIYKFVM